MKITGYEAATLNILEDDPLANMPEEAGRTRRRRAALGGGGPHREVAGRWSFDRGPVVV